MADSTAEPTPPRPTDIQRRCWTITETRQCGLFNGHPGDHLFGEIGQWLHHHANCGWHTGKGCDCGLVAIYHTPSLQPVGVVEGNDGKPWIRWSAHPPDATAAPLDRNLLGRAIHRAFRHGVHGPGPDDGDGDLAQAILDQYAELAGEHTQP